MPVPVDGLSCDRHILPLSSFTSASSSYSSDAFILLVLFLLVLFPTVALALVAEELAGPHAQEALGAGVGAHGEGGITRGTTTGREAQEWWRWLHKRGGLGGGAAAVSAAIDGGVG